MTFTKQILCGFIFNLLVIASSYSDASYYETHERGWHWYEQHKNEVDEEEQQVSNDPSVQMDAVRNTIKRALDQAYLNPTTENVKNYKIIQDQVTRQADRFSNTWKAILLENPELDYSLRHPTNNVARMIESDMEHKKEDAAIYSLSKKYGLFFFYRSTCPYCRAFAPIVKSFATTYGIHVVAITTDGISLPEFPHSQFDNGQAARLNVRQEPSLFAVNPYTQKAFPITNGLMSMADLKRRILEVATQFGEKTWE